MMVPLPETIKASQVLPKQTEYLANLLNIGNNRIISRPAISQVAELATPATPRGLWVWNGDLWGVWGTTLYKGVTLTSSGTIAGTAQVGTDNGFTQSAIAAGAANYFIDDSDVLTEITDPDLPACIDVTRVDGRFIWTPTDGSVLLYSDVDSAGSVDPLAFFDAEVLPDLNLGTENIRNDLFVFGGHSIERFRNNGTPDQPFLRVNNSIVEVGLVGAKIKSQDSVLFLGIDRNGGYAFFVFEQGTATKISDDAINERLNLDYTPAQLATCQAQRWNWRGQDCFVFTMPDRAYLFQNGRWSYIDTGVTQPTGISTFPQTNATLFNGVWYLQDENGLCKLDDTVEQDYTGEFSRRIHSFARLSNEDVFCPAYMELGATQGLSTPAGTIGLSLTKNGRLWSSPYYRSLGATGNYDERLRWQPAGGLGRFDGFMGFNFYTTAAVVIAADSLVLE